MEIWEIAAVLGQHHPEGEADSNGDGRDIIAERMAHAAGKGPKPEADRSPIIPPEATNLIRRVPE